MTLYHIAANLQAMGKTTTRQRTTFARIQNYAKGCFAANVIAQSFCWLGITTTIQVFHVFEESIWAFTILGMTICCYFMYNFACNLNPKDKDEKNTGISMENVLRYMKYFLVFGPIYVAYMGWVDVPMYYNRWRQDELNNHQYYSFVEGLGHAASCKVVTGQYSAWAEDFSWMLGYFSFAVWTSIWLVHGISP